MLRVLRARVNGRRVGLCAGVAVAVACGFVAVSANGFPVRHPQLRSGQAWLPSTGVGELTLLDGSSVEVAARVQVAPAGDRLDVVQHDEQAYAVDRTKGAVRRVDPVTFDVGPAVAPLPGAGAGLTVLVGGDAVYTLDADRGVLAVVDSRTLQRRGDPVTVSTRIAAGGSELDKDGRLWILDSVSGDLVRLDGKSRRVRHAAARPDAGSLALADGSPVLMDAARRTATTLDLAGGGDRHRTSLDLRPDDRPLAVGAAHDQRLYVLEARGALALCDLGADDCSRAVAVGAPGSDLGAPVEVAGRVFVPDYSTGSVWIVDAAEATVVANPRVVDPKVRFQLLTRDGIVFFNDPASEQAGVIRLDGTVRHVAKYDPKDKPTPTVTPSRTPSPPPTPPTLPFRNPPAPTRTPGPARTPTPARSQPGPSRTSAGPTTAPTVGITLSRTTATVGVTVSFQAHPAGGTLTAVQWQFGDGQQSGGTTVNHAWTVANTYQVTVQATFADGRTATASVTVTVSAAPVPQSTLTLQVQGAGTVTAGTAVCPPTCTVTADRGTAVQLSAQPAAGSHLSAWGGSCTGAALTCAVTLDADRTASATFAGTLPAPALLFPDDGWQFHNLPRTAQFDWATVAGAATYEIEIQRNGADWQDATLSGGQFGFQWPADDQGRWRVTAIGADGAHSAPSAWRSFSWNTTAIAMFGGLWQNVDGASQRRQMQITVTSSSTATMRMFECPPGLACGWVSWGNFTYVDQTLNQPQPDNEQPSIDITVSGNQLTMKIIFSGNRGTDSTDIMTR